LKLEVVYRNPCARNKNHFQENLQNLVCKKQKQEQKKEKNITVTLVFANFERMNLKKNVV
jgi:hypothetical protein